MKLLDSFIIVLQPSVLKLQRKHAQKRVACITLPFQHQPATLLGNVSLLHRFSHLTFPVAPQVAVMTQDSSSEFLLIDCTEQLAMTSAEGFILIEPADVDVEDTLGPSCEEIFQWHAPTVFSPQPPPPPPLASAWQKGEPVWVWWDTCWIPGMAAHRPSALLCLTVVSR